MNVNGSLIDKKSEVKTPLQVTEVTIDDEKEETKISLKDAKSAEKASKSSKG